MTNWTLSDRRRRLDLKVAVAYTSDPARVLDALGKAAKAYPKALAEPAAVALRTGFRDSALNFEVRVWTVEEPDVVRSELAVAVHGALAAGGIEIAFREMRSMITTDHRRPGREALRLQPPCGVDERMAVHDVFEGLASIPKWEAAPIPARSCRSRRP